MFKYKTLLYLLLMMLCCYGSSLEFDVVDHYFGIGEHMGFYIFHFYVCLSLILVAIVLNGILRTKGEFCQRINSGVFLLTIFFVLITCTIKWNYYTQRAEEIRYSGYVYEISVWELREVLDKKKSGVLYVERQDCRQCQDAYTHIYRYAVENHLELMLYNTSREYEEGGDLALRDELLERLNVTSVPTILVLERGEVVDRLFHEDIVERPIVR